MKYNVSTNFIRVIQHLYVICGAPKTQAVKEQVKGEGCTWLIIPLLLYKKMPRLFPPFDRRFVNQLHNQYPPPLPANPVVKHGMTL